MSEVSMVVNMSETVTTGCGGCFIPGAQFSSERTDGMVLRILNAIVGGVVALLIIAGITAGVFAQPASRIDILHTVDSAQQDAPPFGRDFWFCIPQNFDRTQPGAAYYFYIYISSTRNTVVHIQAGNAPEFTKTVTAYQTTTIASESGGKQDFPQGLQLDEESDNVHNDKTIHVWSNDADLSVYFMSRAPFTSDGMYCIPTVGWGTEYVVASYNAFDRYGLNIIDLPSEFCIVANQDNTHLSITPSYDIRAAGNALKVVHSKGQLFTLTLNKGECIQYQSAGNPQFGEDLTGTVIISDKSVGVIGASVCPNIKDDDNTCDHVIEMMPPVRTWSDKYFTAPFTGRQYGGDAYLVIGTVPGQKIFRNGNQAAVLGPKYDFAFINDDGGKSPHALWTSDSGAFLLVQYVPSASFGAPGTSRNIGDPDMVVVNPAVQFGKKILFQIPVTPTGRSAFQNFLNIILPASHEAKTTIDGKPLSAPGASLSFGVGGTGGGPGRSPIPGTQWEAILLGSKNTGAEGSHLIASDTTVGLYLYGRGSDDGYAWAGALGIKSPGSPDTLCPAILPGGSCFCARVKLYDKRKPLDTKLNSYGVDSLYNMYFTPDPLFVPGIGLDSSYYDICVIDSSVEAYISVSSYDIAGNRTTVISTYAPGLASIKPDPLNFTGGVIGQPVYRYDTIYNTGQTPYNFIGANVKLKDGTVGFTIDSLGSDGTIPGGGFRIIKLKFIAIVGSTVRDTLLLNDDCTNNSANLIGNGGAADFVVTNYPFDCTLPNDTASSINYTIVNTSPIDLNIDSIWVDDNIHYGYNPATPGNQLPVPVPNSNVLGGKHVITFTFTPAGTVGPVAPTTAHFLSKQPGVPQHTAQLSGKGCAPLVLSHDTTFTTDCDNTLTFRLFFQNFGNLKDSLVKLVASDTNNFKNIYIDSGAGLPYVLPSAFEIGASLNVNATFTPTAGAKLSGCFPLTVALLRSNGDTAAKATCTVCTKFYEMSLSAQHEAPDFGAMPFGNPKVQDYIEFCNTGPDAVTISRVDTLPSKDSAAFRLTGVYKVDLGAPVSLPITVPAGSCVQFYVEFDPSFALDAGQFGKFGIEFNGCNAKFLTDSITAETTSGAPAIQGFNDSTILSCVSLNDSVIVRNTNPSGKTIVSVGFSGTNAGNFTTPFVPSASSIIPPNQSFSIPIVFTPSAQLGQVYYSASFDVTTTDGSRTDVLHATIKASAGNFNIDVNSTVKNPVVHPGDILPMPVTLNLAKNGLKENLDTLHIQKIILTYTYPPDLLDLSGTSLGNSVTTTLPGWSLDGAASVAPTPASPELKLVFTGNRPLTDADKNLGIMNFLVTLPKTGHGSAIALTSSTFVDINGDTVQSCVAYGHRDTSFTLVYQCGDTSINSFMNGGPVGRIISTSPNPVHGTDGSVKLRYSLRKESKVTLSIIDALGNEVSRILNSVEHPSGTFEVYFDPRTLPSGSYVYRYLFDDHSVQSGRLVIER